MHRRYKPVKETFINYLKVEKEEIWQKLFAKGIKKNLKSKELIFREADPSSSLFYLKSGQLEVFVTNSEGKELVLNDLTPGTIFGDLGLILDTPRSASVRSISTSEIIIISKNSFLAELGINRELCQHIVNAYARRIVDLSENLRSMALEDVYYRIKILFASKTENDLAPGNKLERMTHDNIAKHVGSSREMVSKIMKELIDGEYLLLDQEFIYINRELPSDF